VLSRSSSITTRTVSRSNRPNPDLPKQTVAYLDRFAEDLVLDAGPADIDEDPGRKAARRVGAEGVRLPGDLFLRVDRHAGVDLVRPGADVGDA